MDDVVSAYKGEFGKKHIQGDPLSEWPTCSGLMIKQAEEEIMRFASEYEDGLQQV